MVLSEKYFLLSWYRKKHGDKNHFNGLLNNKNHFFGIRVMDLIIFWKFESLFTKNYGSYKIKISAIPRFQINCPVSKYGHRLLHGSLVECSQILTGLK